MKVDARSPRAKLPFSPFSLALCEQRFTGISSIHKGHYEGDWVVVWVAGR